MQKFIKAVKQYGVLGLSLALPAFASAQTLTQPPVTLPSNTVTVGSLTSTTGIICQAINWLFYGLIVLTVIFVLIAAFRYLTASGDPEKVKAASNTLLYAVVAVIVALLAKGIPAFAGSLFGLGGPSIC